MRLESTPSEFSAGFKEQLRDPINGVAGMPHTNGGVGLGIDLSAVTPDKHTELSKALPAFTAVSDIATIDELRTSRLRDALTAPTPDTDPYHGREPKRFLNLRKIILEKTVAISESDVPKKEADLVVTWHLADTIKRNVGSRNPSTESSVTHDTEFEDPLTGKKPPTRILSEEVRPATRRDEAISEKLWKIHKKERGAHATHHHIDSSYPKDGVKGSPRHEKAFDRGRKVGKIAHVKADKYRRKYLSVVDRDVKRYQDSSIRRDRRNAKLAAVERAIDSRP